VPTSKSSLYNVNWKNRQSNLQQPFPDLFTKQEFGPTVPNEYSNKIGYALFNNSTRQQLRDLTQQTKC
jgi:hypothetical protein